MSKNATLPEYAVVLKSMKERLAKITDVPNADDILLAYKNRDVDAMFEAIVGCSMKDLLTESGNIDDAADFFPGVQPAETHNDHAPIEIRAFRDDTEIYDMRVKGDIPVKMTVVNTYFALGERHLPENLGRAERVEDFERETLEDPEWSPVTITEYDCADWQMKTPLRFKVYRSAIYDGRWQKAEEGEYVLTNLEKMTVARWNGNAAEPLFDMADVIDGVTGENEFAVMPIFNTGLGFMSYDVLHSLELVGIIKQSSRIECGDSGERHVIRYLNPVVASNYLYQGGCSVIAPDSHN